MTPDIHRQVDDVLWGDALSRYGTPGRAAAVVLRYVYAVLRDVLSGQLTLRAMSLVYTTLLSIVPLLAFSFSVLKGFGVHRQLEDQLYVFLAPLGEDGDRVASNLIDMIENVNGGVLGGISLAFFIYTAISMVQKIEESFNYVWFVAQPRSFARRFSEYMLVLLVGPLVVVIALGIIASLRSTTVVQEMLETDALGVVFVTIGRLLPYLLIIGVFTFMYWFIPNTRVKPTAALFGGAVGGFLWASLSVLFTTFIANSAEREAIYSSFALPIVTLIWLYLNWLILLIGAQFAYYFQNPVYLRVGRREPNLPNSVRERMALNVMFLVGQAFRAPDRNVTVMDLAQRLRVPALALEPIVGALESHGLLTSTETDHLVPGRDVTRIRLDDILAVMRRDGETGSWRNPVWTAEIDRLGRRLDEAISNTVGDETPAELLDAGEAPRQ